MKFKKISIILLAAIFFFVIILQTESFPNEDTVGLQNKTRQHSQQRYHSPKQQMIKKEREAYPKTKNSRMHVTGSSSNVDLITFWPYGTCWASGLDMSRNLAVIGNGYAVQALDLSTPSAPSLLGEVTISQEPRDIEILGNYAYVLTWNMLFIVDMTDPTNPSVSGSEEIPDQGYLVASGFEIAVIPGYAFAAVGELGCKIIDVSNPSDPNIVGNTGGSFATAVAVNGDYLYILVDWFDIDLVSSVYVYDISIPLSPSFLGYYDSPQGSHFPSVDGTDSGIAYVTHNSSSGGALHIIDFNTDPSNPSVLGSYLNSSWYIYEVEVNGNYAYLAESDLSWNNHRLEIVNISSPSSPSDIGDCTIPYSEPFDFNLSGNYVGMAHYQDGFALYDVFTQASPFEVGHYDTPSIFSFSGKPIVLSGDYAYVANGGDGLRIFDISTPTDPVQVGICDTVNAIRGIALSGNYVYGADGTGVWVVDVSIPSSPVELPYYAIPWATSGVTVVGQYAYVMGTDTNYARLYILDISNPSSLSYVGFYNWTDESGGWGKFVVSGDYLYVVLRRWLGDWNDGCLKIVDISTPASPTEVGSLLYDDADLGDAIAVRGDYAYLISDYLHVVSVSNPLSPSEVTSVSLSRYSADIVLSGNFAYLASRTLSIFDISDPSAPFEAAYYYPDTDDGRSLAVAGNYAYVLGSFYILKNTLAPEISIASPSPWATVSGSVSIGAEASHTSGITQVEFYVDDVLKNTDTTSPYSYGWDTTVVANGSYTLRARAHNTDGNSSDAEITVTVNNVFDPAPEIKANGSDGPITIAEGDPLEVTISLDSGDQAGENADWWILMRTDASPPNKWLYFDLPTKSWLVGRSVTRQGKLFDLSSRKVPKTSGLSAGTYVFYFAVDMNMDGAITLGSIYYDKVKVTITN